MKRTTTLTLCAIAATITAHAYDYESISTVQKQWYQDNPLLVLFVAAIAFVVGVFLTRAIFSIPRLLRHHKAQTQLLLQIAANTKREADLSYFEALNIVIRVNSLEDDVRLLKVDSGDTIATS